MSQQFPNFKYDPKIVDTPDGSLEVTVEIPGDATTDQILEAMNEAAELIFPGITGEET